MLMGKLWDIKGRNVKDDFWTSPFMPAFIPKEYILDLLGLFYFLKKMKAHKLKGFKPTWAILGQQIKKAAEKSP